jgi:hypothetical protein
MPTSLPFPTSNNAPLPIPGGYGNPTGANTGSPFPSFSGTTGQPFPTMPAYNAGTYTGTNLGGLNSGLGFQWGKDYGSDIYNRLGTAYGKGPGQLLGNILSGGLFNPQVAAAFLNAQQPGIARGEANIQNAFGDAGARFSSAAALGMGDYESQVQLNQQQMLASLFENAQGQELSLLSGLLPTLHQERADEGGFLNKLLGGIGSIAGLATKFIPGMSALSKLPGFGGNTGTFGANAPSANPNNVGLPTTSSGSPLDPMMQPNIQQTLQASGGNVFGGGDMGNPGAPLNWDQLMMMFPGNSDSGAFAF